ncbi:MAG TPA: hypothetical protein VFG80_01780 [Myxococcota bacterium]|nr:hypothetical protein [Myxococcota bacterium]
MRRRFGRRRSGGAEAGRETVDPRALERAAELGLIPLRSLEPVGAEDIPESLAALVLGEGPDGRRSLAGFAPQNASGALLAGAALALRLREQSGFDGEVIAVAPRWDEESRRLLAVLEKGSPLTLRAVEAPALADAAGSVAPAGAPANWIPVRTVLRAPERAEDRALLQRTADALGGLAAKHGGALRGFGESLELSILGRRMASLRADGSGVVLELLVLDRSSLRLAPENLSDALDRLEGLLRKHLNDRRVREGEDGWRSRVLALLPAAELRDGVAWPLGGREVDVLDGAGVAADGAPVVAAFRRQMTLAALREILGASFAMEPFLPEVLADAKPPVRLGAPRLLLVAEGWDASVRSLLPCLGLDVVCLDAGPPGARSLALRPLALGARPAAPPAATQPDLAARSARETAAPEIVRPEPERPRRAPSERGRAERPEREPLGRSDRERRPQRPERAEREPLEPAARAPAEAPAPAPGFEEVSLFDLEEEPARGEEGARRRGRRRRGRGRGRARREGEGALAEAPARDEGREGGEPAGRARRGARPERGRETREVREARVPRAREADDEGVEDEEDLLALAPEEPLFEAEPAPRAYDDEEDDEEDPALARMHREREERRRARLAKAAPEPAPEPEAPRAPRRRVAVLAHADRDSLAAAVLLARDTRLLDGIWVYPQAELMTFFRSVATDLREDAGIFVIGFAASPARDVLQAAALYRDRLTWFDHHDWPPEDLEGLRRAIGADAVHVAPGARSSLAAVLPACTRRSRFSDKLLDLVTGRFTQHDWERWGGLWWSRLGEVAHRTGERRSDLDALLAGRPSDLAREAARAAPPPPPAEAAFAAQRDFRVVHFGGWTLVVVPVPGSLDLHLAARIVRERYGAQISLAHPEEPGSELLVLGADEGPGRRAIDLGAMVDHLAGKFAYVEALPDADHVARLRVRDLARQPERFDEVLGEIAMGRSLLEG